MRVKVLFFGMLKDLVGCSEEDLEVPQDALLRSVFEHYASRFPGVRDMSASIVLARNQEFSDPSSGLREGDEVALLPPVSGGSPVYTHEFSDEPAGHFFALTREPIQCCALSARLLQGRDGAVVHFEGVVRNNSGGRSTRYLDYEGYEPLALKTMTEIGREIAASFAIDRIALVHRLGRLEIGETSVAVLATAPHRRPAFEAALEGINRLKRRVPIWKKEHFEDGEIWVEGEWDERALLAHGR